MAERIRLFDDHVHLRPHETPPPPHRLAPVLEAAAQAGIEIGVREHAPLPQRYRVGPRQDYDFAMSPDEVEPFLREFVGQPARLGLEVDFFPHCLNETLQLVDAILNRARSLEIPIGGLHGSIHLLPGDFDDVPFRPGDLDVVMWDNSEGNFQAFVESRGIERIIEDFHDWHLALVRCGLFQAVAHVELLRKFDRLDERGRSRYFAGKESLYEEALFDILRAVAETDMAVELNTQGVDRPLGRPFLSQKALNYCAQKGIPVCFGSDAHRPEELGRHFDIAARMLQQAGIERLVTFRNLKPEYWYPFE